jgi:hypothetical protein
MKFFTLLLLGLLLGACTSLSPENTASSNLKRELDKWVGHSIDDLVSEKGAPSEIFLLEAGGRVYEYAEKAIVKSVPLAGNVTEQAGLRHKSQALKIPCEVQFIISATNVVERWMTEGDCN